MAAAVCLLAGLFLLTGCGPFGLDSDGAQFSSAEYGVTASPRITRSLRVEKGGGRAMVGDPYRVAGRWYTPQNDPDYEATGMASWYGSAFHGRLTANGEVFDMNAMTGAHPTLPLPSYVRVTNLENGRSVVVRLNDRGPFTHGRVIDVSGRAADLLGFRIAGTARVRVNYVGAAPLEGDDTRALLATYYDPHGPEGEAGARVL
ncbi:MAG: septal ring lytic transglycosylase RlpA family protein, partial [Cucumibacter sp.]